MTAELIEGLIETLTVFLADNDYRNSGQEVDYDQHTPAFTNKEDSPFIVTAREQLNKLKMLKDFGPPVQFATSPAPGVVPPTSCQKCQKNCTPICPYEVEKSKNIPSPNPCPAFLMMELTQCPLCKGFRDTSDMRQKEQRCITLDTDITKNRPQSCRSFEQKM